MQLENRPPRNTTLEIRDGQAFLKVFFQYISVCPDCLPPQGGCSVFTATPPSGLECSRSVKASSSLLDKPALTRGYCITRLTTVLSICSNALRAVRLICSDSAPIATLNDVLTVCNSTSLRRAKCGAPRVSSSPFSEGASGKRTGVLRALVKLYQVVSSTSTSTLKGNEGS